MRSEPPTHPRRPREQKVERERGRRDGSEQADLRGDADGPLRSERYREVVRHRGVRAYQKRGL